MTLKRLVTHYRLVTPKDKETPEHLIGSVITNGWTVVEVEKISGRYARLVVEKEVFEDQSKEKTWIL